MSAPTFVNNLEAYCNHGKASVPWSRGVAWEIVRAEAVAKWREALGCACRPIFRTYPTEVVPV